MLVQRNAPQIVRDGLRAASDYPVRAELPDRWSPRDGPVITVTGDGTPRSQRSWTRENVRVAVYTTNEPHARDLGGQIDAFLLNPHHLWGLTIVPGPGLIITRDRELGAWVAAVSVAAASTRKEQ